MKKLSLALLFAIVTTFYFVQTLPDFDAIKLETILSWIA